MNLELRDFAIRELGCTACSLYGVPYRVAERSTTFERRRPAGAQAPRRAVLVGLCQWHHVGRCHCDGAVRDCPACRLKHGPSWRHHKREFLDTFGDGDQLLAVQDNRIERWRKYG